MADMDEFFNGPEEYDHPKLRSWIAARKSHPLAHVEFHRPRDGLSFRAATLYLFEGDNELGSEPWDPDLNVALMENGFKASTEANEAQRLGHTLKHMLEPIETRFGDGFFNAVLVEFIRDSALGGMSEIRQLLSHVHVNKAHAGQSRDDCLERIKGIVKHCARLLEKKLNYQRAVAERILASAVEYYVDERFNVSNRKRLGWT